VCQTFRQALDPTHGVSKVLKSAVGSLPDDEAPTRIYVDMIGSRVSISRNWCEHTITYFSPHIPFSMVSFHLWWGVERSYFLSVRLFFDLFSTPFSEVSGACFVFKRSNIFVISVLAVFTLFAVVACVEPTENPFGTTTPVPATEKASSGGSEPVVSGPDIANGESLFKGLGCSACHTTGSDKLVGPGLSGISSKGNDYILESIVDPAAVIVYGFNNLMPTTFASLKESDLEDLIAYLKTLG